MGSLLRTVLSGVVLAAALASSGCAAKTPTVVLTEAHAAAYVYHHPRAEVVAAVRKTLDDRGFKVKPMETGEAVYTEWKALTDDEEFADSYHRYYVVVHRLTREHTRVTAVRLELNTAGMETYHPTTPLRNDGKGRNVNTVSYGKGWRPLMIGKPRTVRDLDLEWALIRRLDPTRAKQINAVVDYEITRAIAGRH